VEDLRRKYKRAINTARNAGLTGFIGERDGRLFFKGSVGTHEQAARIWTAIKDVPSWRNEVIADIQVLGFDMRTAARGGKSGGQTA
jgi:hypothetical protein